MFLNGAAAQTLAINTTYYIDAFSNSGTITADFSTTGHSPSAIAAVAEAVGRTISENTKTALAAAKARGVKLGNPNGARALRGAFKYFNSN